MIFSNESTKCLKKQGIFFCFYPPFQNLAFNESRFVALDCTYTGTRVGSVNAKILISYCGSPEEVFKKNKAKLMRIPGIGEVTAAAIASYTDFERAAHEVAFIQKHSIKALPYTHPEYPYRLKEAEYVPVIIYYLGNAATSTHPKHLLWWVPAKLRNMVKHLPSVL